MIFDTRELHRFYEFCSKVVLLGFAFHTYVHNFKMRQFQRFSYAMAITYPNDPNMVSKGCKNAFDSINIVKVVLCCANVSSDDENEGGSGYIGRI